MCRQPTHRLPGLSACSLIAVLLVPDTGLVSEQEIREAGAKAEVIEDYPGTSIRPADYCRASPALDGPAFSSIVCGVGHDEDRHDL
jgi:hypothetical protein